MKYIVDFHNDAPDAEISKYLADNGCTVLKEWDNFDKVFLVEAASEPPAASIVAHVVDNSDTLAMKPLDIEINPYYATFNPNYPTLTIDTNDKKDWWKNFTLPKPVFDQPTTQISKKGDHVHVYIMDSGIKSDHPEFANTDISYLYSVTPGDYTDHKGHGTAIASIIAGATCGISSAKIKVVKILDSNHQTLQSEFLDALDAILADVPVGHFAVLNASWCIPRNEWVEYKLRELMSHGVWTIAAAGNSGHAIEDVTPAAMPEAFTVGAYNSDLLPCDFSDYTGSSAISVTGNSVNGGGILNGWAPGQEIYVAALNGGYSFANGTSMAAAVLSAVTAHNLNDLCYSNGEMLPGNTQFGIGGPDLYNYLICGRKDLLDLSDPKYANSVNIIATLSDVEPGTQGVCTDEALTPIKAGAKGQLQTIFDPHNTKSIEVISGWPTWAKILPTGSVWAEVPADAGPTDNEPYKMYESTLKRVLNDGYEEIIRYDIAVLKADYKPSDLPEDHIINVTMLGVCNQTGFSCAIYFAPNCFNLCPPGSGCCVIGKFSNSCFCAGWNAFGCTSVS